MSALVEEKFRIYLVCFPSPIHLAADNGHTGCFELLWKEHRERNSHLVVVSRALSDDSEKLMKMIISTGFDLNQGLFNMSYRRFSPPLHTCNGSHNTAIIKLLLEAGVDVNQEYDGYTALMEHASHGTVNCVNALIEAEPTSITPTSMETLH